LCVGVPLNEGLTVCEFRGHYGGFENTQNEAFGPNGGILEVNFKFILVRFDFRIPISLI
jgi:hypothetical protein